MCIRDSPYANNNMDTRLGNPTNSNIAYNANSNYNANQSRNVPQQSQFPNNQNYQNQGRTPPKVSNQANSNSG